jgi:hypothetical protein
MYFQGKLITLLKRIKISKLDYLKKAKISLRLKKEEYRRLHQGSRRLDP